MRVLVGQPPRPELGKGGSIIIGDLSGDQFAELRETIISACNAVFGGRFFSITHPIIADLRDGLGEIAATGAFRPPVAPVQPLHRLDGEARPVAREPDNGAGGTGEEQS